MLTNDWFGKTKCCIEGEYIVVDGEKYRIESIEEDDVYHMKLNIAIVVVILLWLYMAFLWGYGVVPELLASKDRTNVAIKIFVMLFTISCTIWGMVMLLKAKKHRGCWKINGFKYIYLEVSDGPEVYAGLRDLQKLLMR